MERRVYIPPEYIDSEIAKPVIFLAGPIQGAPDWQSKAVEIIKATRARIIIASPRRLCLPQDFQYVEQVDWETDSMERTQANGVVLFWCPRESHHIDDRSYGQTTRVEYGRCIENHRFTGSKMVLGMEIGFSGTKYFRYLAEKYYPEMPIFDNLRDACLTAVGMVRRK